MNYQARVLSRNAKPMHEDWEGLHVRSLSWQAMGGCDRALLSVRGSGSDIAYWMTYLGHPIEVYDEMGQLLWWGWLEGAREDKPGYVMSVGLDGMANRVSVAYASQEPEGRFGEPRQTAWADDLASQALYGIKEHLDYVGSMSMEQAEHWRNVLLSRKSMPHLEARPKTGAVESGITLSCKGWIHRLDWCVWQRESGVIGNTPQQSGVQAIGEGDENTQVAQSFKIRRTVQLSAIQLRLRRQGLPGDQLRIDIRTDQNGAPGAGNLASCLIDPKAIDTESYAWVNGTFHAQISLDEGRTYWFVLSRTGAVNSDAYYMMGVDENLHFAEGPLKLYRTSGQTWQPRLPMANALFKLGLLSRVDDEINAMLALTSDFLTGAVLESPSGLRLQAEASSGETLLKALKRILALGTSNHKHYLMEVDQERFLRIFLEPPENNLPFTMNEDGEVYDHLGRRIQEKSQLLGKRVRTKHDLSFMPTEVQLNTGTGAYRLKTN